MVSNWRAILIWLKWYLKHCDRISVIAIPSAFSPAAALPQRCSPHRGTETQQFYVQANGHTGKSEHRIFYCSDPRTVFSRRGYVEGASLVRLVLSHYQRGSWARSAPLLKKRIILSLALVGSQQLACVLSTFVPFKVLNTPSFYYSTQLDITHSLQRLNRTTAWFSQIPLFSRADLRCVSHSSKIQWTLENNRFSTLSGGKQSHVLISRHASLWSSKCC